MSARTKARKRAVDLIYSSDLRQISLDTAIDDEASRAAGEPARQASWRYALQIVSGVRDQRAEIDELIETYAQGWTLERMPVLDRAIIRVGIWEILHNPEVPNPVAISEAVTLAEELSTDESGGFINGLLARIASVQAG